VWKTPKKQPVRMYFWRFFPLGWDYICIKYFNSVIIYTGQSIRTRSYVIVVHENIKFQNNTTQTYERTCVVDVQQYVNNKVLKIELNETHPLFSHTHDVFLIRNTFIRDMGLKAVK